MENSLGEHRYYIRWDKQITQAGVYLESFDTAVPAGSESFTANEIIDVSFTQANMRPSDGRCLLERGRTQLRPSYWECVRQTGAPTSTKELVFITQEIERTLKYVLITHED